MEKRQRKGPIRLKARRKQKVNAKEFVQSAEPIIGQQSTHPIIGQLLFDAIDAQRYRMKRQIDFEGYCRQKKVKTDDKEQQRQVWYASYDLACDAMIMKQSGS